MSTDPGGVTMLATFVPAKDHEVSRAFYRDLGFEELFTNRDVAGFRVGDFQFLLQNFYVKEFAENFMMSLMVEDLDAWWEHLQRTGVVGKYAGVRAKAPAMYPWGLREIHLIDPTGVLWHVAQKP